MFCSCLLQYIFLFSCVNCIPFFLYFHFLGVIPVISVSWRGSFYLYFSGERNTILNQEGRYRDLLNKTS